MNAFAALWRFDGAPASTAAVTRMLDSMPGGGQAIWNSGPVALGQTDRPDAPAGPPAASDRGLRIAGTYRLDNRADLQRELGQANFDQAGPTDAELILRACLRWGESAPERLLGDFAFVLWDEPGQRMLCARDHLGIAPFYYHVRPGKLLACATEARALLTLAEVPPLLDEEGVAAYLTPVLNDGSVTLVRDVRRLRAGSVLVIDRMGVRPQRRYWRPDPRPVLRLSSDQEYAEALRTTLTEAVRCRLPTGKSEGTTMSGGLDSSSVSTLLSELRGPETLTPVVSVLFGASDERRWIETVLARGGFKWHPVNWGGAVLPDPAADIGFFTGHVIVNRDAFAVAAQAGVRVLFGGGGGDEALSWGHLAAAPVRFVLRERQWTTTARVLAQRATRRLRVFAGDSSSAPEGLALLSPALARRLDAAACAREQTDRGRTASPRTQHARLLEVKATIGMREAEAALAARHGIGLRSPFWDRRVIELCLAMPLELKEGRDGPRYVLRRAMEDLVPASILSRRKWSASAMYLEGLRRTRDERPQTSGESGPLSELIDTARVRSAWTALEHPNPPIRCVADCLTVASLECQVQSHGLR